MRRIEIPESRGATKLRWPLPDPAGDRLVLELPAVAGRCRVSLGGRELAVLGPSWTPLWLPLDAGSETDRQGYAPAAGAELRLEVEPVENDPFAGFLPDVQSPPRGLWQGAFLRRTGPACFERAPRLEWTPDGGVKLEAEWDGPEQTEVQVNHDDLALWSPDDPAVGRMRISLSVGGKESDGVELPMAARSLRADGERLLLNDAPFQVRGLLHWGLYPGLAGPDPEPETLRAELRAMREHGFNLLKCCLWLPPTRFLDVCDEEGMPVWLEYPLWKQPLTKACVPIFRDWIAHDASHPCVVLRTFTCENDDRDADAAAEVAAAVRCLAPDTLLADNSAWIGHTHLGDFHDEHPYLHNAQWPFYLQRLRAMLNDLPAKPLLLGETMVADASADDPDSRRLAMAVRRYQAESLIANFPHAGYVICGASDAPNAPLGVRDRDGKWKDAPEAWAWQKRLGEAPPERRIPTLVSRSDDPAATNWPDLPNGVVIADSLDDKTRKALRDGATVLHFAAPRAGSWRTPEALFWSWVPVFDGPAAGSPTRELLLDDLPFDLLSGRCLAPHPTARVLVGLADVHDQQESRPPTALVMAARVGAGRLLISSLRSDTDAGRELHTALLHDLPADLPRLELPPPRRTVMLDGPWQMEDRTFPTGTLLLNNGANAAWGACVAIASLRLRDFPAGPASLFIEAVADGWELFADGERLHRHGRPGCTWDAGRDVPATVPLSAAWIEKASTDGVELQWRLHDHRGAGVLVGPIWLVPGAEASADCLF